MDMGLCLGFLPGEPTSVPVGVIRIPGAKQAVGSPVQARHTAAESLLQEQAGAAFVPTVTLG